MTDLPPLDPLQSKIHNQLIRLGPGPAALFRDACRLFHGPLELESATPIASHVLRELKSSLKDVLLPRELAPEPGEEGADKKAIGTIANLFGLPEDHHIVQIWGDLNLHGKAHRRSLGTPRSLDDLKDSWRSFQELLSLLLDTLDGAYSVIYDRLDKILAKERPGKNDLKELQGKIPNNPHTFGYFFEKVTGDRWFQVLSGSSFFEDPPSFGFWPQAQYLKRMASEYPEEVAAILERVVGTWNYFTYYQVLEAVPKLSPKPELRILKKAASTLMQSAHDRDTYQSIDMAKQAGAVASHDPNAALDIVEILLMLTRDSDTRSGSAGVRDLTSPHDRYTYSDILEEVLRLVEVAPEQTLRRLLKILDASLSAIYAETKPEDYSRGWMPAIEPHVQNSYHSQHLPVLFEAVRDAAEGVIERNSERLHETVKEVEDLEWLVTDRLVLHLIRKFGDPRDETVRSRVVSEKLFFDHYCRHEYGLLLRASYSSLGEDQKYQILDWIKSGPRDLRDDLTPDDQSYLRDVWARLRLSWIRDDLSEEDLALLRELEAKHGQSDESEEFTGYMIGPFWGPTSPVSRDNLSEMDPDEVIAFLGEWEPTGERSFGVLAPTREGLGRDLQAVVKARAAEFSARAESFIGLDATYVRSVIEGLEEAVKEGVAISWAPVLRLAAWAVAQNRQIPDRDKMHLDSDEHWGYARAATSRLLLQGFFAKEDLRIPLEFREIVWNVIAAAAEDPDPDPTRDTQEDHPHHAAINSTRGVALQAVMRYASWVRGEFRALEGPDEFEDMPEVEAMLNRHLDVAVDSSPAVRSIYGEYLFFLHLLFPRWVEGHMDNLLPAQHPELAGAVLTTYLSWGQYMSAELNALLAPQLARSIAAFLDREETEPTERGSSAVLIGQCAAAMYIHGDTDLSDDSLLAQFLAKAEEHERVEVISLIPSILNRCEDSSIVGGRDRAVEFWSWYRERSSGADLRGFDSWVVSDHFDAEWRLDLLIQVLERTGGVMDVNFRLIEHLTQLLDTSLDKVFRCLRMIAEAEEPRKIQALAYRGHLETTLRAALDCDDPTLQKEARAFTNRLVAIGFRQFRDLLGPTQPADSSADK